MSPAYVLIIYKENGNGGVELKNVKYPVNREELQNSLIELANDRTLDLTDDEHIQRLDDTVDVFRLESNRLNISKMQEELVGKAFSS